MLAEKGGGPARLLQASKLKQHLDERVSNFYNFRFTLPNQSCSFKGRIKSNGQEQLQLHNVL